MKISLMPVRLTGMVASAWIAPTMAQVAPQNYPAFCQGMSIDGGENLMFVTGTFLYPQTTPPPDGVLREGAAISEFSSEVTRRTGKKLLDSVCHTRPTADEITQFAVATVRSNGAGWKVATLDWRPRGARALAPATTSATEVMADPLAIGLPSAASLAREEVAGRSSAARQAEADRLAAERSADAEKSREANARALAETAEQTRKIEEDKRAAAARLAQFESDRKAYEGEQKAYEKAKADHEIDVAKSETAHRQWEADVVACRGGDRTRCGSAQ